MFLACPHCRYLVATDPLTQAAPELCPRCGGAMSDRSLEAATPVSPEASKTESSLASLLRKDDHAAVSVDDSALSVTRPVVDTNSDSGAESATSNEALQATPAAAIPPASEATEVESIRPADSQQAAEPEAPVAPVTSTASPESPARASTRRRVPGFAQPAPPVTTTRHNMRWQWIALVLLSLTLIVQILLADRDRLAADAQWRPWMARLCSVFGCSLPPWRDPTAFTMLDRDVRPLPGVPGVLRARATFRNDAPWPQRWPTLRLTLKDADGRTLGARALKPDDYLDERQSGNELAPGQSAQVAVHVREPSANVVAFSFDFR